MYLVSCIVISCIDVSCIVVSCISYIRVILHVQLLYLFRRINNWLFIRLYTYALCVMIRLR